MTSPEEQSSFEAITSHAGLNGPVSPEALTGMPFLNLVDQPFHQDIIAETPDGVITFVLLPWGKDEARTADRILCRERNGSQLDGLDSRGFFIFKRSLSLESAEEQVLEGKIYPDYNFVYQPVMTTPTNHFMTGETYTRIVDGEKCMLTPAPGSFVTDRIVHLGVMGKDNTRPVKIF